MIGALPTSRYPSRANGRTVLCVGGVLLGLTMLGACRTATVRQTEPRFEPAFSAMGSAQNVPLVSLPNSGPIASVQETRSGMGLRQRILFGASRGRIDLTVGSGHISDDPPMVKPSRDGMAAELASLEDGGAYSIVSRPVHNAYGPIGVAVNGRCAYAWQWLDGQSPVTLAQDALRGPVSVSLRVLHCYNRPTTAETLLADLARLRLGPAPSASAPNARPRRIVRSKPAATELDQSAQAVVPQPEIVRQPIRQPNVAVNASRTLVTVPEATEAPSPTGPSRTPSVEALPVVPRPVPTSTSPGRARYLTDALPSTRGAEPPATPSQPTSKPANQAGQVRSIQVPPPSGW